MRVRQELYNIKELQQGVGSWKGPVTSGSGSATLAVAAELQNPIAALVIQQPKVLIAGEDSTGTGDDFATASEGSGSAKERSLSPKLPLKSQRSPTRQPVSTQKSPARKSSSSSPAPPQLPDSELLSGSEDDSSKKEKRMQKRKRNVAISVVGQQGKLKSSSSKESEA